MTNINLHGSRLPRSSRNGNEVNGNMTMGSLLSSLPKTPVKDQYIGLANGIMRKESVLHSEIARLEKTQFTYGIMTSMRTKLFPVINPMSLTRIHLGGLGFSAFSSQTSLVHLFLEESVYQSNAQ